jgi:dipeptidyl aminopeptidase/acylaminoacyl peptidase
MRIVMRRIGGRSQLAFLVALSIATLAVGQARAAFPGANGEIVFRTNRDGNAEIYTMNADGSGRVDLTRNPAEDVDPRWSPGGTRIVFASNRSGNYEIYTMNADGGGLTRLTYTSTDNRRPAWTADGHILFDSNTFPNRIVYRINADGSGLQQLTPASSDNAYPTASPRGNRIAFSSLRSGTQRLYTMNADGGAVRLVTPAPPGPETSDVEANWSPRANDLVFVRFDSSNGSDLYAVHTDGSALRQLTNTPDRVEFEPAWSPDGTKIVFHACSGLGTPDQHCAVYTMNADGSDETEISTPRAPYLDTFSGDRIDPFWGIPFVTGGGVSIAQVNGELEISVPSSATLDPALGYISVGVDGQCRLVGDFDVQVDYRLLTPLTPGAANMELATSTPDFSVFHGIFVFNPGAGTAISTHFPGPVNAFAFAPQAAGSLRLQRIGATWTAYRFDAGGWVPMQTTTDTTTADQLANLNVFSNAPQFSHPDVNVAYDNFRINGGTFSCPSWWDDNAPDWQPLP